MSNAKTKLTPEMFPFPAAFREESGGYWEYLGDSIKEWRECAMLIERTGERMKPLLGPPQRLAHVAMLDFSMVFCLLGMTQQHHYRKREWLRYASDFPHVSPGVGRSFSTNYNYLIHFGLAEKRPIQRQANEKRNPQDIEEVEYRVTEKGHNFINGSITCPAYLINRRARVIDQAEEQVFVYNFIGRSKLEALQSNPLWWEDEEDRQDHLGDQYRPVDWSQLPYVEEQEPEKSETGKCLTASLSGGDLDTSRMGSLATAV